MSLVRFRLWAFLFGKEKKLFIISYGVLAQSVLEARRAHNPKVTGSNPVPAIYAQIAQLVEQRTENPRVAGSIPALGISFRKREEVIYNFIWGISSVGRALDF